MTEIQLGTAGTLFQLLVSDENGPIDVSTATTKSVIFRTPDGTPITKTATFSTDGTDGYIEYSTMSGDIDRLGYWEVQSYVLVGSDEWWGVVEKFRVLRNATP